MTSPAASRRAILNDVKTLIPPLSEKMHKGQAGRVGITGGSRDYTGAPYFASMSSMRLGADMSHTICEPDAGNVIKTYSPDLIVHRILKEGRPHDEIKKDLEGIFQRLHSLVVGPGLGRDDHMQSCAKIALQLAREKGIWTVVDADGLWLVSHEPEIVKGWDKVVLTPNVVEFGRLCDKMNIDYKKDPLTAAKELSKALGGVVILEKGSVDRITNGVELLEVDEPGGLKRSGGQGDILSGTLTTFLAWARIFKNGEATHAGAPSPDKLDEKRLVLLAAYGASTLTRNVSREVFKRKGRALLADDLLDEVGPGFERLFGEGNGSGAQL
ncbi:unnamed protein product [Sympodiomycopsis kandeliae]